MKSKSEDKKFLSIIVRYFILFLLAIPNLFIFYFLFTPLTVYAVYFLLSFIYEVSLVGTNILVEKFFPIEIVRACVAGSAYYLLTILNLSTPNLKIKRRLSIWGGKFGRTIGKPEEVWSHALGHYGVSGCGSYWLFHYDFQSHF